MKNVLLISLLVFGKISFAQNNTSVYSDSINAYQKNYINTHEVVKGEDRKYLHFFAPDSTYKVLAAFEKINDVQGFDESNISIAAFGDGACVCKSIKPCATSAMGTVFFAR